MNNWILFGIAFFVWIVLWLFRRIIDEWVDNATFKLRAPLLFRKYFEYWVTDRYELRRFQFRDVVWPVLHELAVGLNSAYMAETDLLNGVKEGRIDYKECNKKLPGIKKRQWAAGNRFYMAGRAAAEVGFKSYLKGGESYKDFLDYAPPSWLSI